MPFSAQPNNDLHSFSLLPSPSLRKGRNFPSPQETTGLSGPARGVESLGIVVPGNLPSQPNDDALAGGAKKVETGRKWVSYTCEALKARGSTDDWSGVRVRLPRAGNWNGYWRANVSRATIVCPEGFLRFIVDRRLEGRDSEIKGIGSGRRGLRTRGRSRSQAGFDRPDRGCQTAPASTNTTRGPENATRWSSRCPRAATFQNFDFWNRRALTWEGTGLTPGTARQWRPPRRSDSS